MKFRNLENICEMNFIAKNQVSSLSPNLGSAGGSQK
jgi:hypothetical protein